MNLLCIGDVFGSAGRDVVARVLPGLLRRHAIDFVIANGENVAHGAGITPGTAGQLFAAGVDVITGGNHTGDRSEGQALIAADPRVLRPANYPPGSPGRGHGVYASRGGVPVAVINLQGRVFMPETDDPFRVADRLAGELGRQARVVVVDLHAEATSEKVAMAWYLDGRVSALVGTHTHVATADARVLPGGTAYISDAGMTGSQDSVIGAEKKGALDRFLTALPQRLSPADGDPHFSGLLVDIDESTGRARSARLLYFPAGEQAPEACRRLSGKPVADAIERDAGARARALAERGVVPALALLSVGDDEASRVYLAGKRAAGERAGIRVGERRWTADDDPETLAAALAELGRDPAVHGVLLQLPLPAGWDTDRFLSLLPPAKDVDGFHPANVGRLALGMPGFVPCTPLGIRALLRHYEIPIAGRHVVVAGRSAVVGRPLANLLSRKGEDATVTVVHSRSADLAGLTRQADVLVVAIGRREFITAEHVRPGAAVVDVGMHRIPDPGRPSGTRLVGDVESASVARVAGALSPVPGGVGPLTVACLLANTVGAAERAAGPRRAETARP
jgi:2',3'-cyclic-nucleotide 2'-phosphodiesterase